MLFTSIKSRLLNVVIQIPWSLKAHAQLVCMKKNFLEYTYDYAINQESYFFSNQLNALWLKG